MRTIRIEGGPVCHSLRVVDAETGQEMRGVARVEIVAELGCLVRARVDFLAVEVAVTAEFPERVEPWWP